MLTISAACECGAEEQTVDYVVVVLHCPINRHSPWSAWPHGSGRWGDRMASQHLPRDLVRPNSGLKELFIRWTGNFITGNVQSRPGN